MALNSIAKKVVLSLALLCGAVDVMAAAQEGAPIPTNATLARESLFFENHIRPLLAEHCYACHDRETGPENGELILETVSGIRRGGSRGILFQDRVLRDEGSLFDEHAPEASLLWRSINYEDPNLQMPPSGRLPKEVLDRFRQWIERGAILPRYEEPSEMSGDSGIKEPRKGIDWESARDFWAFKRLSQDFTIPDVGPSDWPRQPVDRFVLERLQANGLSPSPEAAKTTLLRRLTLIATGLLPTPEEQEQFLGDSSVNAFEKAVDRVMASPALGERMARHWLDLARYTDFTPEWQNPTDRGWIYRDWVVTAFNNNLPYDQFVSLQLAADMLPQAHPEDLASLGFLGLSPTYWKELKLAPSVIQQIVADEWDERIDAVSRTFLGLTVACARCHDHKFDPITTSDYYALAGVFASTQFHEQPLLAPEEAKGVISVRNRIAELETKIKSLKEADSEEASNLKMEIARLQASEPRWDMPQAHTLREASVYVVPDGPDSTKLEFRENEARDLPIFRRGNPSNPGEVVPRRYLEIFSSSGTSESFHFGSGRKELADSLMTKSQGLVARVMVNRVWLHAFGQGIVGTPSDFGIQGDPPTHPELLEYLAAEFVSRDWDLKWLYSQLLKSATWRQSTNYREGAFAYDPENKLLWRMNRRAMEFEQWRDAILQSSGQLDRQMFGPSSPVDSLQNVRRTLYVTIAREELHPILRLHDFPEASAHSPKRNPTITPLQQLFVLNSPWIQDQAKTLFKVLESSGLSVERRIESLYQSLFGRDPSQMERDLTIEFLEKSVSENEMRTGIDEVTPGKEKRIEITADESAWTALIQGLFGLNEFAFID